MLVVTCTCFPSMLYDLLKTSIIDCALVSISVNVVALCKNIKNSSPSSLQYNSH